MAREDGYKNLIPTNQLTEEELRSLTSRGGKASVKARRKKADLRKAAQQVLTGTYKLSDGTEVTGEEAVMATLLQIATNAKSRNAVEAVKTLMALTSAQKDALDTKEQKARIKSIETATAKAKAETNDNTDTGDIVQFYIPDNGRPDADKETP